MLPSFCPCYECLLCKCLRTNLPNFVTPFHLQIPLSLGILHQFYDNAQVSLLCCESAQGLIINLYIVAYTRHPGHDYFWCDEVNTLH